MPSTRTSSSKETKKKVLVNRYKVDRKLGSGNFGTVFVVEDLKSEDKWLVSNMLRLFDSKDFRLLYEEKLCNV